MKISFEPLLMATMISFAVLAMVIAAGLNSNRVTNKKQFVLWALLVEYLLLVVSATVLFRQPIADRQMRLMPLWIYSELATERHIEAIADIVLNLILFMPLGALLAGLYPSLEWHKVLLIGLACSLTIEALQYIFFRGIAQTDDVIHNMISSLLGWCVTKLIIMSYDRE